MKVCNEYIFIYYVCYKIVVIIYVGILRIIKIISLFYYFFCLVIINKMLIFV